MKYEGEKRLDQKEFEELLMANMGSMYNLAQRMTGNRDDSYDLVQEASLRAFRNFDKFEKGTNFKAWVLTVLRNIYINQYRKKVKEPYKVNYDDFSDYVGVPATTGLQEEIFGESLQNCIDQLSEDLKSVITLFYVDGLSYKEIAKVMDCPIGTVMSRLYMARHLLKKRLTEVMKHEV